MTPSQTEPLLASAEDNHDTLFLVKYCNFMCTIYNARVDIQVVPARDFLVRDPFDLKSKGSVNANFSWGKQVFWWYENMDVCNVCTSIIRLGVASECPVFQCEANGNYGTFEGAAVTVLGRVHKVGLHMVLSKGFGQELEGRETR